MNSVPFPELPAEVMAALPEESIERELICATPECWASLSPGSLADVLWHALVVYGITQDIERSRPVRDLYGLACHRLSAEQRLEVIDRLADYAEASRRSGRFVSTVAFLPGIRMDPDPRIVASASLNTAALMGAHQGDSMAGRRSVHESAIESADSVRGAWVLSGLIALGDAETLGLLRRSWIALTDEGRDHLADTAGTLPFAAVAIFLVLWAEDAIESGDENEAARALGALGRLAEVSRGRTRNQYSGRGIIEVRRRFPAWAYPADEVVQFGASWSTRDFGRVLEPRLRALAKREREKPRVAEWVLELWRER